jgi:hypothetical protein
VVKKSPSIGIDSPAILSLVNMTNQLKLDFYKVCIQQRSNKSLRPHLKSLSNLIRNGQVAVEKYRFRDTVDAREMFDAIQQITLLIEDL